MSGTAKRARVHLFGRSGAQSSLACCASTQIRRTDTIYPRSSLMLLLLRLIAWLKEEATIPSRECSKGTEGGCSALNTTALALWRFLLLNGLPEYSCSG